MDNTRKNYTDVTLRLLGSFQLLEFALKVYIGLSYKVIQTRVESFVHFDFTEGDLSELPLGRLLNLFKKFNSNSVLFSRIQKLQSERNKIAHRSLLITLGPLYDFGAVEDKYIEYLILEDELAECLRALCNEIQQLKERAKSVL